MNTQLNSLFLKNICSLAQTLDIAIKDAMNKYTQIQNSGQKGKLTHIYISFLFSSVLCKLPWLRIDLYDEKDLSDLNDCYVFWNVQAISDDLYQLVKLKNSDNDRIKDYELEHEWLAESKGYFEAFKISLPDIIKQCELAKKLGCTWHYGRLFEQSSVVWKRENNDVF